MKEIRKMTFGKYKGQPILSVIAQHIGYIMWCFENIPWFELNDDEQKFYDWEAIAIKKYGMPMLFPVETMYKHVRDKEALENLETPYEFRGRESYIPPTELSPILLEAGVIWKEDCSVNSRSWTAGLQHSVNKDIASISEEEIEEMNEAGITPPIIPRDYL